MPSKTTMTLIYILKTTMSSIIACLQRRRCPHLHFKDDNVFGHCMPSKMTMSSSTFQRRQFLQSLHAFKRRQCHHLHFEDDNVFTSKTLISFSPMLRRTRHPLFVHFQNNKKRVKMKMKVKMN